MTSPFIDPAKDLSIRRIVCAGEPGAGIPSTRKRLEEAWGAKVFDHVGATEIGAWGYECTEQNGLHLNEARFLVEVEDLVTGEPINGISFLPESTPAGGQGPAVQGPEEALILNSG